MYNSMEDTPKMESGLPRYEEGHENETPPSYNSLYGQIKEARKDADGQGDFLKKFCTIICNTIGFTIVLAICLAIPILMIVVGALNLDRCPIQRLIPIWLIVSGVFSAIQQVIALIDRSQKKEGEDEDGEKTETTPAGIMCGNGLLGCFNFAWFICGCVWVYRIYAPETDDTMEMYCDHLTYYLSFWLLTSAFIVIGLVVCCTCCLMVVLGASSK